ncbi:hypothetical protein [Pantoea ananatis]|nr:hypothetical protein [Pantoea ananatis]URL16327.1 hypothetical protein LVR30_08930 [Pantoea ananatis]
MSHTFTMSDMHPRGYRHHETVMARLSTVAHAFSPALRIDNALNDIR